MASEPSTTRSTIEYSLMSQTGSRSPSQPTTNTQQLEHSIQDGAAPQHNENDDKNDKRRYRRARRRRNHEGDERRDEALDRRQASSSSPRDSISRLSNEPLLFDELFNGTADGWKWWQLALTALIVSAITSLVITMFVTALREASSSATSSSGTPGDSTYTRDTTLLSFESSMRNFSLDDAQWCLDKNALAVHVVGPLWNHETGAIIIPLEHITFDIILSNSLPHNESVRVRLLDFDEEQRELHVNSSLALSIAIKANEDSGTFALSVGANFARARGLIVPIIVAPKQLPNHAAVLLSNSIQVALLNARDIILVLSDACPYIGTLHDCNDCNATHALEYSLHSGFSEVRYGALLINGESNGNAPPTVVHVAPGEYLRVRVINSASGTPFSVHFGDSWSKGIGQQRVRAVAIAVDAQWLNPVELRLLNNACWLAPGQRMDVLIHLPMNRWQSLPIVATEGAVSANDNSIARNVSVLLSTKPNPWTVSTSFHSSSSLHTEATSSPPPTHIAPVRRRAMTLSDEYMFTALHTLQSRSAYRHFTLRLFGASINERQAPHNEAQFYVKFNERIHITFINEEMGGGGGLSMRISGHSGTLINLNGKEVSGARRNVVYVPGSQNVTIAFEANNPGQWRIGCIDEMRWAAGMQATLNYVSIQQEQMSKFPISD